MTRTNLIKTADDNYEAVCFYYNVYKEKVAFYTSNRLGYSEFNNAFEGILNKVLESEKVIFNIDLLKNSLNLDDIKKELKKIGVIKELKIEIKAPNPDSDLLDRIKENKGEYIADIKNAKVTKTSTVFTSNAPSGLNLDSKIIDEQLDRVDNIHYDLDSRTAVSKGYVDIYATGNKVKYSTKDNGPIKSLIEESQKSLSGFVEVMRGMIGSIF